jgi:hypothetical protein
MILNHTLLFLITLIKSLSYNSKHGNRILADSDSEVDALGKKRMALSSNWINFYTREDWLSVQLHHDRSRSHNTQTNRLFDIIFKILVVGCKLEDMLNYWSINDTNHLIVLIRSSSISKSLLVEPLQKL